MIGPSAKKLVPPVDSSPIAQPRCSSGTAVVVAASAVGCTTAPPTPCTKRAPINTAADGAERAGNGADAEDHQPTQVHRASSEVIGEAPGDGHQGGEGEEVGADDPLLVDRPHPEIAPDDRQRDGGGRLVEEDEGVGGQRRAQDTSLRATEGGPTRAHVRRPPAAATPDQPTATTLPRRTVPIARVPSRVMSAHLQSFSKRPLVDRGQPLPMRELLHAIHAAKDEYARLPFFQFLRDESVPPRERLAFVPCMAPFIMDFGDLNRYVLRDPSSDDPYQQLVNEHTFEDDHHWPWYLEDVAALGHDQVRSTTDVLRELYSDRMAVNRLLASKLAHLVADATPIERLVVIEAIEETGNVLFTHTAALARRRRAPRRHRAALPRRLPPDARVRTRPHERRRLQPGGGRAR